MRLSVARVLGVEVPQQVGWRLVVLDLRPIKLLLLPAQVADGIYFEVHLDVALKVRPVVCRGSSRLRLPQLGLHSQRLLRAQFLPQPRLKLSAGYFHYIVSS